MDGKLFENGLFVGEDANTRDSNTNSNLNDNTNITTSIFNQNYEILKPKIVVFGVGGAGTNAVNNMYNSHEVQGVEFIIANTDAQSLAMSPVPTKIQLGPKTTKGLGAGMVPEVGREATEEVREEILKHLEGVNMLFITAGMGGGTGTGAAPVIAKMARELDILTVAVVTKPFIDEGKQRMTLADDGVEELKKYVNTLIVVPNQNLYKIANEETTLQESFQKVDFVLRLGVKGITDLITQPGLVNLDFADIKTVMSKMGKSMMGMGEAKGENRTMRAVEEAITNPLLDNSSIKGAKGVVVNITASLDFGLFEYNAAIKRIREEADENAMIITGNALDKNMEDTVRISVFATGILEDGEEEERDKYTTNEEDTRRGYKYTGNSQVDESDFFDIANKREDINLEDKYNAIRKQAELQYQKDLEQERLLKKDNKGIRNFFGLFSQNTKKQDNIQLSIDEDDFDNIDINTYKYFNKRK